MKYLAIDYGDKRTGLATCDQDETIASPLNVIADGHRLIEKIIEIIDAEQIEAIVLGLPLNMDGSQGWQAQKTQQFAEKLKERIDIPIHLQDERLSSFAAEEKIAAAELTRKKKRKRLDAIAAAEILYAFLENKKNPQ